MVRRILMLGIASLWAPLAAGDWADGLQLHGFVSQGFVKTSANRWYGDSPDGSWDLREMAVNLSLEPDPRWRLSAQVLSRTAGDMDGGALRLDYGLVDWVGWSGQDGRAGLRLGRVKNPVGFFNETRDVPFTRPSIFLPQGIYFDRVHDIMLSADGVHLYGDWHFDLGDLFWQLGAGLPLVDTNAEYAFLGRDWRGKLEEKGPLWVGQLGYDLDGGRYRAILAGALATLDFTRGAGDPAPPLLDSGEVDYGVLVASLQYNAERWSLTGEFLTQEVDWRHMGALLPTSSPGQGYYLQADYRFTPSVQGYVRYGARFLDRNDKDGTEAAATLGVPAHTRFAKDWSLGLRWDPLPDLMLRAEYSRVDGTAWLSNRENSPAETERRWDLFALEASYRF